MRFVIDASMAAAWLLPEQHSEAVDDLLIKVTGDLPVPSLFWHEMRNILLMAERRGRIAAGDAVAAMTRLRRLPLIDAGPGQDSMVLGLATDENLTAYDAAYLELALESGLPLATLDGKLAVAAGRQNVSVLRPLSGK
jgi:predicted nucleic acid-binding protein